MELFGIGLHGISHVIFRTFYVVKKVADNTVLFKDKGDFVG